MNLDELRAWWEENKATPAAQLAIDIRKELPAAPDEQSELALMHTLTKEILERTADLREEIVSDLETRPR